MARCNSFTILRQGRSTLLTLFVLSCIFLASCGGSKSPNSVSGGVATIIVSPSSVSVAVNATQQFTATAKDASGNTVTGVTFTWASSATNVATINSSGMATGIAPGTTQITAAASGVTAAADALQVTSPSGVVATITVSPSAPSVAVNATQQFTATAKDASGNTVTGVTFTWASSATNVATIDSSGLATGIAIGTTQITAAASGVTSATDAFTITAQVAACANDANLAGGYAMMLQGWTGINSVNRPGVFMGMVGSFHADGNGNITQGIADANASSDGPTSVTFTATYCLASNNLGTITMTQVTPVIASPKRTLAFSLGSDGNGSIEFYDASSGFQGSGSLRRQQTLPFSTSEVTGNYVFGFVGVNGSAYPNTRQVMVGQLGTDGKGNITAGEYDASASGGAINGTIGTSTFTVATNGRGTGIVNAIGFNNLQFVFYVVNSSEMLFIENDIPGAAGPPLLVGQALQQINPSFNGVMVIASEGYLAGSSVGSQAQLGLLNANGNTGTLSLSMDGNSGGVDSTITETANFTMAANGRVSFASSTCNDPFNLCPHNFIPYLVGPNQGFIMGNSSGADFGKLVPQSGIPSGGFTNASLSGSYLGGSEQPINPNAGEEIDAITFDGVGAIAATGYTDGPDNGASPNTSNSAMTYAVSPNGRVVVTCTSNCVGGTIIYIVSPSQFAVLPEGQTNPYLIDFKK
jgi:Bacterial Ig-like domain (group 2)